MLATVVIELKKLILGGVLEGDEGPLDHVKVHQVYPIDIRLINFHGQCFQGKVEVDLLVGRGCLGDEYELVEEVFHELQLLFRDLHALIFINDGIVILHGVGTTEQLLPQIILGASFTLTGGSFVQLFFLGQVGLLLDAMDQPIHEGFSVYDVDIPVLMPSKVNMVILSIPR